MLANTLGLRMNKPLSTALLTTTIAGAFVSADRPHLRMIQLPASVPKFILRLFNELRQTAKGDG